MAIIWLWEFRARSTLSYTIEMWAALCKKNYVHVFHVPLLFYWWLWILLVERDRIEAQIRAIEAAPWKQLVLPWTNIFFIGIDYLHIGPPLILIKKILQMATWYVQNINPKFPNRKKKKNCRSPLWLVENSQNFSALRLKISSMPAKINTRKPQTIN